MYLHLLFMTVFWIWYCHWQRTIIRSSEYSQTTVGNVTQTTTVVSTTKNICSVDEFDLHLIYVVEQIKKSKGSMKYQIPLF